MAQSVESAVSPFASGMRLAVSGRSPQRSRLGLPRTRALTEGGCGAVAQSARMLGECETKPRNNMAESRLSRIKRGLDLTERGQQLAAFGAALGKPPELLVRFVVTAMPTRELQQLDDSPSRLDISKTSVEAVREAAMLCAEEFEAAPAVAAAAPRPAFAFSAGVVGALRAVLAERTGGGTVTEPLGEHAAGGAPSGLENDGPLRGMTALPADAEAGWAGSAERESSLFEASDLKDGAGSGARTGLVAYPQQRSMRWSRQLRISANIVAGTCKTGAWACVSASISAPWPVTGFGDDGGHTSPTMGNEWIVEWELCRPAARTGADWVTLPQRLIEHFAYSMCVLAFCGFLLQAHDGLQVLARCSSVFRKVVVFRQTHACDRLPLQAEQSPAQRRPRRPGHGPASPPGARSAGGARRRGGLLRPGDPRPGDWFQPWVDLNAAAIAGISSVVGSGGAAIILYTVLIKIVTYPVTQPTLRTNAVLQLVAPQREYIERKYKKNDEATSNKLQQRLFAEVGVNPLASLLPVLLQLPIFIGLFRAIAQLARQDARFNEPFLFVPSLAGPVESGRPSLDWMLKTQSAQQFIPLCGWDNLPGYLALPFIVVVTQLISQSFQKVEGDSSQPVIQIVFPTVVGISCLVSPAGLGLYWLTNNVITTGLTLVAQNQAADEFPQYKDSIPAEAQSTRYVRDTEFIETPEAVVRRRVEALVGEKIGAAAVEESRERRRAEAAAAREVTAKLRREEEEAAEARRAPRRRSSSQPRATPPRKKRGGK
ncbi:unnamed protein product [Prorocentrum cordatum]|uniref:Membrane insertase YidC/Oxa/ALB C-terminal domain-containing protein n=1 Tax=Prorocentrum cordatum TaxID=2364126 RepID=A0ABN9PK01_9DINO|nr:unnamed protein product [Polarella glacialis]